MANSKGGMMKSGQRVIGVMVLCFSLLVVAGPAICDAADEYPNRGVEITLAMGPGGGIDLFYRAIREALGKELGAPVSIVNRAGGNMSIGCSFVMNSKPDGYTLIGLELPSFLITQAVMKMPYDAFKNFDPVAHAVSMPLLLVARTDGKFGSMEELIAYAKKNPGKVICGTSGQTQTNRFDLELLKRATGTDIDNLPLVAGGELISNLLGGHVDFTITNVPSVKPHIEAGKLKALATLAPQRLPAFPDVPTTKELGIPQVNINSSYCLLGPKGLPQEVKVKLGRSLNQALKETAPAIAKLNLLSDFLPAAELAEKMQKDFQYYSDVAKKAGIENLQK
jgi:tripartite-type tricarboxylate transporter receptor subunit TctC